MRIALLLAAATTLAGAQRPSAPTDSSRGRDTTTAATPVLRPVQVQGRADDLRGSAVTASQGRVGRADLRLRPLVREGELLEAVPGMILTQHSGDGKSNQMFVRGFNLDHGTDFQTRIEGMPVNLPTHGHGQGYSDLNVLIPELVDHLEYKLGNYYAELGDFGAAGGATLHLSKSLAAPILRAEAGAFGYRRAVAAASRTVGRGTWLLGGEGKGYDGPWDVPQGLRKLSGVARYSWRDARTEWSVLAMTYRNRWTATDQVPARAVADGVIGRFGSLDPTLGGRSGRHSLSASVQRALASGTVRGEAYVIRHELSLWSNFTYFLDDPARGDQIQQRDDRTVAGFEGEWTRAARFAGADQVLKVGTQGRYDDIAVSLARSAQRTPTSTVRADDVRQGSVGAYASLESRWTPVVRTVLGVRQDGYRFDVASDRPENSGTRSAGIASPKGALIVGPWRGAEFYVSGGLGFHSNDARGTVITVDPASGDATDRVNPLVRSRGAEVGFRASPVEAWRLTAALWQLGLDSELLFVGDAGTTEPQGRSRRVGVTVTNFWRPDPRLTFDADVSFTRARFMDAPAGDDRVPGALENVIAAGATWEPRRRGPVVALRVRHMGAAALIEDNSARATPTTLWNLNTGWRLGDARLTVAVLNLLGARGRDIQYFYASRLRGEPVGGVEDLHFHPVEPRQLRISVGWGN